MCHSLREVRAFECESMGGWVGGVDWWETYRRATRQLISSCCVFTRWLELIASETIFFYDFLLLGGEKIQLLYALHFITPVSLIFLP